MIYNVQSLRFIAAILITILHFTAYMPNIGWKPIEFAGAVDLFFVISGFIIYTTTVDKDYHYVLTFLKKRFLRVYLYYWLAVVLSLPLLFTGTRDQYWLQFNFANAGYIRQLLSNIFLYPHDGAYFIEQSWTLPVELFFYGLFAFALLLKSQYRIAALFLAFVLIMLIPNHLLLLKSLLNFEFIAGMCLGYLYREGIFKYRQALWVSIVVFVLGLFAMKYYGFNVRLVGFGVLSSSILGLALYAEENGIFITTTANSLFGGRISYLIYLLHITIIRALLCVFDKISQVLHFSFNPYFTLIISIIVTIIASSIFEYRRDALTLLKKRRKSNVTLWSDLIREE